MLSHQVLIKQYNFIMLKFLDNRTHEKAKKSPIKYKPEMVYGISIEAPETFQTPFTLVHSSTYVNPYLEFQQKRQQKLPQQKTVQIHPLWTKKTNLQMVEEQKIISSSMEDPHSSPLSRYRKSYKDELQQCKDRFKITRGQFTDFIEKNNRYKSVGPIHGKERTVDRIQTTKKSVWLKPDSTSTSKMLYSTYFDMMRQSSMKEGGFIMRNQSTISSNSKLISQKGRIRDNRQKMNVSFQRNLQQRKHSTHFKVQLPKLHSQLITRYEPFKIKPTFYGSQENQIKDIDQFESKLHRQFK